MKEDQPGTGQILNAEKIELLAQTPMVAPFGFFQPRQILVQLLLGEPGCAVNALQLLVLFVAFPVGASH